MSRGTRLVLPRLSRADAAARHVLVRRARQLPMPGLAGHTLTLEPLPFCTAAPPAAGGTSRIYGCGVACYALGGAGDAMDRLVLQGLGATPALTPDAVLRLALLTQYLDDARRALGAPAAMPFVVNPEPLGGLDYGYAWRVIETVDGACGRTVLQGTLHCNAAGHRQLAELVGRVPVQAADTATAGLARLCLPQQFLVGTSRLSRVEILALRAGDVVLIQQPCLVADALTVRTAPRVAWRARLRDTQLQVLQGLHLTMNDTFDDPGTLAPLEPDSDPAAQEALATAPPAGLEAALDGLRVTLSFDLGQRGMSMAELRALAPGDVIELGRPLDRAVTMRAHGQAIASGELVEIDGRLGVAIVALQDDNGDEHPH